MEFNREKNYNALQKQSHPRGKKGWEGMAHSFRCFSSLGWKNQRRKQTDSGRGGGGGIHGTGDGSGGGFNGGASTCGVGATQTTGNALGKGADSSQSPNPSYHHSGSGGGYYGGSYPWCDGANGKNFTGYGGSGYINYPLLKNKYMYGYNVNTSDEIGTKTYTTTNVSDEPVKDYAKRGDGYARITYLGTNFSGE